MVLPGMGFMDVLAVLLQGGTAHPALLAVIGVFNVCCPETQQSPRRGEEIKVNKKEGNSQRKEGKGKKRLLLLSQKSALEFWLCIQLVLLLLTCGFLGGFPATCGLPEATPAFLWDTLLIAANHYRASLPLGGKTPTTDSQPARRRQVWGALPVRGALLVRGGLP